MEVTSSLLGGKKYGLAFQYFDIVHAAEQAVSETIIAGDIDGDCTVNFKDFALMALHWLEDNNH